MWQYVITGVIILAAAAFVAYRVMKTFRGKDTFSCAFCTKETCPSRKADTQGEDAPDDDADHAPEPSADRNASG